MHGYCEWPRFAFLVLLLCLFEQTKFTCEECSPAVTGLSCLCVRTNSHQVTVHGNRCAAHAQAHPLGCRVTSRVEPWRNNSRLLAALVTKAATIDRTCLST